jgi:hypothetical protein
MTIKEYVTKLGNYGASDDVEADNENGDKSLLSTGGSEESEGPIEQDLVDES